MKKQIAVKDIYLFCIIMYFIALPLNVVNIGLLGSALKLFAILPVFVAIFSGRSFRFYQPEKWQLLFTFFASLSAIWSTSYNMSVSRSKSYIMLFALLCSGTFFEFTEKDVKKLKYALVWSSRIMLVLLLYYGEIIQGRLWLTGIITEDPNYLCAYFSFGAVYVMDKIINKNRFRDKLLGITELILYIVVTFLTGSRGGLIALFASIGAYIIVFSDKRSKHIMAKCICLVIALLVINFILEYLPENLKLRFTMENVVASGGSGRVEIWENAMRMYKDAGTFTHLFGFGTGTARYDFILYGYRRAAVIHNIFIETLIELGIVGVSIYTAAIFSFIKKAFKFYDKYAFSVIICMLVLSLSTSLYTFKPYFNIMLFIIISQRKIQSKNEN